MSARHLSSKTKKTYLSWARRFLSHFGGRDPAAMGRVEVEQFIQYLAEDLALGPDSQNQAASSLTFMYRELWGVELSGRRGVTRARSPHVVPKLASPEEVDRVLSRLTGRKQVMAMLMYGSGARVAEATSVRIKDIALGSRELVIRGGKGAKDRTTVIPRAAIEAIRGQMQRVEEQHTRDLESGVGWAPLPGALHRKDPAAGWDLAWQFLFPSTRITTDPRTRRRGRRPIHPSTIQRAMKTAVRESGVAKPITCHTLRHCFATELLRAGCDIRTLQRLMGHRDLKTTSIYLHITDRPGLNIESPLDRLPSIKAERDLTPTSEHARD